MKNEYSRLQKDVRLEVLRLSHWARSLISPLIMGGAVLEVDPHHRGFLEHSLFLLQVWWPITIQTIHSLFDYCVGRDHKVKNRYIL